MEQAFPFPFQPRWRMKMGLKPLNMQEWIDIDNTFDFYLQRKTELLHQRYNDVFASLSGSEPAQQEVLELLLDYLPQRFPQHYQRREAQIQIGSTRQVWDIAAFATRPLELAARLIQEDLCLMQPGANGYVLTAGCVCFPSHWRLSEKLGLPIAQIHAPVPGYAETLEQPVNGLFDRLNSEHSSYRINWGIVNTPELFLGDQTVGQFNEQSRQSDTQSSNRSDTQSGDRSHNSEITAENAGTKLWIRIERQTLRRLPQTRSILFTIRTYRYPLFVIEQDAEAAHNLATLLQQMPTAMLTYKNLLSKQEVVLAYLRQISSNHHKT